MDKRMILALVLFVFLVSVSSSFSDDWQTFQHDVQHTGYTSSLTSKMPILLWKSNIVPDTNIIVYNNNLYFGSGGKIYSLNANTSVVNWETSINYYSSITAWNGKIYVSGNEGGIYVLDTTNGNLLNKFNYNGSLTVYDGRLYVVTSSLKFNGNQLYCVNATNGIELWNISFSGRPLADVPPAIRYNIIYIVQGGDHGTISGQYVYPNGTLFAIDAYSGIEKWNATIPNEPGAGEAGVLLPIVVTSNGIFISTDYVSTSEIYAYDLNGNLMWTHSTNYIRSPLAYSPKGILYFAEGVYDYGDTFTYTPNNFYALNVTNGNTLWSKSVWYNFSSPVISDDKLFVPTSIGTGTFLYKFNLVTGDIESDSYKLSDSQFHTPNPNAILNDVAYISTPYGIYAIKYIPSVTILSPQNNQVYSSVTIQARVDGGDIPIDKVIAEIYNYTPSGYVFWKNLTLPNSQGNIYSKTFNFPTGEYQIRIFANDTMGNVNNAQEVNFSIDKTPPSVAINYPQDQIYQSVTEVSATVTDNYQVDTVIAEIDGSQDVKLVNQPGTDYYYNDTIDITSPGYHTIRIFANDTLGNVNNNQKTTFVILPAAGWCKMQEIDIYNPNSYNLTDFQVVLDIPISPLMNPDLSDLRFVAKSGFIPYYIENIYPDTAVVWVKVPFLEAGKNTTIYMYYGNPSASSQSNPKAVFDLYDDFNSGVLNTSLWKIDSMGGYYSFSNGAIRLYSYYDDAYGLVSKISDKPYGVAVDINSKTTSYDEGDFLVGRSYTTNGNPWNTDHWYRISDYDQYAIKFQYSYWGGYASTSTTSSAPYRYDFVTHTLKFYKNKVELSEGWYSQPYSFNLIYDYNSNSPLYLSIYSWSEANVYVNWVRTYKLADQDPIVHFGKVKSLISLVDANGVEHVRINYTNKLFGYSDVNPNLYVHSCFNPGDNVSLGYAGQSHFLRISNYGTASKGASGIDLDIFPFLAVYPGRISANISNNIGISQDYNFGYYVTKTKVDNNKLNVTVLSFDDKWNSIDKYLKENNITIHDPKIIFDLYYPNGSLYYENLTFSNKTFSIPLPKDFSRETYRFYYNGIWSDTIPPNVTFVVPLANQYYFGNVKELEVKVKDDSPISWVIANVDGVNYTLNSIGGSIYLNNSVNFGTGTHNLTVYATDIYNNTRIVKTKFYVYNSPVVGINYSSYYNDKLNEDILTSPNVNVSAYYGVFDNGIIIPLNSEFVPMQDQQHFLGYYIFNTKALIDAGVLSSDCSNMAVYTYNNKEISYSIADCGSANAKLIVNTTDPLYVLVGPVGNKLPWNAPGYSKPAFIDSIMNSETASPEFLDMNGNYILYYSNPRVSEGGTLYGPKEIILDEITSNGLKEIAKTCNLSFEPGETARIINTSDGVYALIPTYIENGEYDAPIGGGYNPRYAGAMYLVKFENGSSIPVKISDIYTNIPTPQNTFVMYPGEQFEASAIGNKILMTSANNSYLISLNGNILKKFGYGNVLTVAQKDYKGKWYLIQFNESDESIVVSKISPDGSIETKDLQYPFDYDYRNDLDKNSMLFIKNDIAYFIDSGTLYALNLSNDELISGPSQQGPFKPAKGIPLHLPHGDEYLVPGSLNANKGIATFLYVTESYVNDEDQYNLTNYEVNLTSGNEKIVTLSQLYSGWDYSSTYSSSFGSKLYLSLVLYSSNPINVYSLNNVDVLGIPRMDYSFGKLNNVKSLNITLKNLNTGEITKLNVPTNSKLIDFSDYGSGIYLINATATNDNGKTTSYSEFIWDKDKPNIQYSISQDGDYVNITYYITDNFGLESCEFNGSEVPCKGVIKLEYPEVQMGSNTFEFNAVDIAGNKVIQPININVNCVHLKPLSNTPFGIPAFYYKGYMEICPGTYHINYPIIGNDEELNLTGVTLIGEGGHTSYESLKRGNVKFVNGIIDAQVYDGALENFDVAAMNSILNGTTVKNSNIIYNTPYKAYIVNSKFENVSGISGPVANSTVNGLPIIFVSDESYPSLNIVNYTDISPQTLGMSKIGGLIIGRDDVVVHNLTIEDGMLDVYDSRNVTIENNTLKDLGIIDLNFYEGEGVFTDNYVIDTKGANILGGLVYNNYFNNSHVPDVSILSYPNLQLNVPLNCSETSIIGGCVGGNHWTTYYGPYNKTEKIGLDEKEFVIENFRIPNSISSVYDEYPLVNSNETKELNMNFSNTYGTSSGIPAFPSIHGLPRASVKQKIKVFTETPPLVYGNSIYFIKSDVVNTYSTNTNTLTSFYTPELVSYNLSSGKINWETPVFSYFDMGSNYRDIFSFIGNKNFIGRWEPKIMTNGKLVCVETMPHVWSSEDHMISCLNINNGKNILYPIELIEDETGLDLSSYYSNFYLYNNTLFVFSSYYPKYAKEESLNSYLCKVNLDNLSVKCGNPIPYNVNSYKSEMIYNPSDDKVYVISVDNSQNDASIYGFYAGNLSLYKSSPLFGIPTTQPVVIDGAVYVGTAYGNNYYISAFKNGYLDSLGIDNKPSYISSFDDKLLITTGDMYHINPQSTIYIVNKGLDVSTLKTKTINGVAMLPTSVNDTIYIPFVENITNTNLGCANRPFTYKVGVIALDKNLNQVWEFSENDDTSLSSEVPAPMVVVPSGKDLLVPVIHYYINSTKGFRTPFEGGNKFMGSQGGSGGPIPDETIYVLTSKETCSDVSNSNGLNCSFIWSAPYHGYVTSGPSNGTCYQGDCHLNCNSSQNNPLGENKLCKDNTNKQWLYCCGSDSLYQICIDKTENCPLACGDLGYPCCQPGNICHQGHCGCETGKSGVYCVSNNYYFFNNNLWGNWNSFLNGNEACCVNGWQQVVIK